jgi:hypothetical protein
MLPPNFTASTPATPIVYYVVTVPDVNHIDLSATPGGSAITPSGNGSAWGFNLVAGFSAEANAVANGWVTSQQQAATAPASVSAQIPVTPAQ